MENNKYLKGHNSRLVLGLIASKWTILVMHALQQETKRFNEINKEVKGITEKVLTDTLRNLERDGIVKRVIHPVIPPKVEYKLTPLGLKLLNVTETMAQWADNHFKEVERAREEYDSLR